MGSVFWMNLIQDEAPLAQFPSSYISKSHKCSVLLLQEDKLCSYPVQLGPLYCLYETF
jgi:hypothetical protein